MIVRATSDLHLSASTVDLVFAALDELRADAAAVGGHTVIVGDVFDQGDVVHMPTWNRLRDMLHAWPGRVYVVVGNHDQYPGGNCLRGLAAPDVMIVDRPMLTDLGVMVPYVRPGLFPDALAAGMSDPETSAVPPVVWCHQGFRGAYLNGMRRDTDGVPCRAVPTGYITIAGHYHMPQNLGPLVYCGSPYEQTFAEEGQRKGWLRWGDIAADVTPTRVPFALGAPRHFTVHWDPAAGPPPQPAGVRACDKVRVVTAATRREAADAAGQLAKAGLAGAPVVAAADTVAGRVAVDAGTDPRDAARWFALNRYEDGRPGYDPGEMAELAEEEGLWAPA